VRVARSAGTIFERAAHRLERSPPELIEIGSGGCEARRHVSYALAAEYREHGLKAFLRLSYL
jgi:hypothetical protein